MIRFIAAMLLCLSAAQIIQKANELSENDEYYKQKVVASVLLALFTFSIALILQWGV